MYKFISSVRLAVILIAGLAGLAVSSTIYDRPDMFQSIPFRVLLICFFINLLTCSVGLWPGVVRTLKRKAEGLVGQEVSYANSHLDAETFDDTLKALRFKDVRHKTEAGTYVLAKQKSPALLAPHVLHVGLLIILVGAFLSGFETEGQLILSPGQSQPLPTAISERVGEGSITVDDFETAYTEDGEIDNWITTFDLKLNGEVIAENVSTRVNHPYKEKGISIYQMAYQNEYIVHIEGNEEVAGDYAIPESKRFSLGSTMVDIEPMAGNIALLYKIDRITGEVVDYQPMKLGEVVELDNGITVEYLQSRTSTVLDFKYSRALPVIFAGFIFSAIGSLLFLLGRYSEVRAFITNEGRVSIRVLNKSPYLRRRQEEAFGISDEKEGN